MRLPHKIQTGRTAVASRLHGDSCAKNDDVQAKTPTTAEPHRDVGRSEGTAKGAEGKDGGDQRVGTGWQIPVTVLVLLSEGANDCRASVSIGVAARRMDSQGSSSLQRRDAQDISVPLSGVATSRDATLI